jgi:DNA-directed RNA polymerase subunit RPC12/RpoP
LSQTNPPLSFHCPQCNKKLKAPESLIGKRVECPKCKARVLVPGLKPESNDADDWLALDGPAAKSDGPADKVSPAKPAAAPPPNPSTSPPIEGPGQSVFDEDLPELTPFIESPAPAVPILGAGFGEALEQLSRDDAALKEYFQPPQEEEFSFPCKVCGTLLYANVSRIGSMTRCPDCHSEFSIPSRPAKKKVATFKIDDAVADVRLAPLERKDPSAKQAESAKTKQMLERAAIEVDREREETGAVAVAFDSKRWLSLIFGFLRDPGLIAVAVVLGIFAAVTFYAMHAVGRIEMSESLLWVVRGGIFVLLGVPTLSAVLLSCLVILPMAANRTTRVEEWPFGRLGEAMGEVIMGVTAMAIAAIPGGILATMLMAVGAPQIISEVLVLLSMWGLTPILLLSMIDNNSTMEPISKSILKSLSARPDAWGAMYFQTGIAIACLFVLFAMAVVTGPITSACFGMAFPFTMFFIANQYGLLAGRISDITELGYEGDFSEDLDETK